MSRSRTAWFVAAGLVVACALALVLAPHASSRPDGLERVAADHGIDAAAGPHALGDGPLADYTVADVDGGVGTGLAGVAGIAVVFGLTLAGTMAARRWVAKRASTADVRPTPPGEPTIPAQAS